MGRKIRNIAWIIALIGLSFPIGYAYQIVYNKMLVYSEKALNFIAGGIAIIIVMGLISFISYKILKKRQVGKDPAKVALLIYSVILGIFFMMAIPYYKDAVDAYELRQFLDLMPIPG
jgi:hypothetical protein